MTAAKLLYLGSWAGGLPVRVLKEEESLWAYQGLEEEAAASSSAPPCLQEFVNMLEGETAWSKRARFRRSSSCGKKFLNV